MSRPFFVFTVTCEMLPTTVCRHQGAQDATQEGRPLNRTQDT